MTYPSEMRVTKLGYQSDWLTDTLRPAGPNRQAEDQTYGVATAVPRVRLNNYVQSMMVGYKVTDAQNKVAKAGIPGNDEEGYQMVKATKEIARDLELALLKQNAAIAGVAGTGGQMGGVRCFIGGDAVAVNQTANVVTFTNHKLQTGQPVVFYITAGGTMPTGLSANQLYFVQIVDANTFKVFLIPQDAQAGTNQVTITGNGTNAYVTRSNVISLNAVLTEDNLNDMMQMIWRSGGNVDSAVMSGKQKRAVSAWTAGAMKTTDMDNTKRKQVVDIYETDFGIVNLEAHRQQDDSRIDFLEYQYWKLAYLDPFHVEVVPRSGTFNSEVITGMVTLECRSPIANGSLINLQ